MYPHPCLPGSALAEGWKSQEIQLAIKPTYFSVGFRVSLPSFLPSFFLCCYCFKVLFRWKAEWHSEEEAGGVCEAGGLPSADSSPWELHGQGWTKQRPAPGADPGPACEFQRLLPSGVCICRCWSLKQSWDLDIGPLVWDADVPVTSAVPDACP